MSFSDYVKSRIMIIFGGLLILGGSLSLFTSFVVYLIFYDLLNSIGPAVLGVILLLCGFYLYAKGSYIKKSVEPKGTYRIIN